MSVYEKLMPVSRPSIGSEELSEVEKVFKSRWLGLGAWVLKFEQGLKAFLGARNVIAVNTGTTAIHLALDSIGIGKGDEVIVPSLTFAATIQAIALTGAKPVFCDVEEDTLNMDVDDMERRITSRTRVVMPVHYCGLPCDMDEILKIARKKNIKVVEDAAHAFGSFYKGRRIGSFGDITCFSFDPIKNITCGEGGAITTSNDELAAVIYKKRMLGIDKDTWSRYKHKRDWFYEVTTLGFRYHMSNINAAIGIKQLEKVEDFISRKRELVKAYDKMLRDVKGVELLKKDYIGVAPFNYMIKVKGRRDELMKFLKRKNIDSGVHYIPNHLQPFFKNSRNRLPVTERLWKEIITLPLYYEMSDGEQALVIDSVREFFGKCRK